MPVFGTSAWGRPLALLVAMLLPFLPLGAFLLVTRQSSGRTGTGGPARAPESKSPPRRAACPLRSARAGIPGFRRQHSTFP
jgi:hypothetical protein